MINVTSQPVASAELRLRLFGRDRSSRHYRVRVEMATKGDVEWAEGTFSNPFIPGEVAALMDRLPRADQVLYRSFSSDLRDQFDPVREAGLKLFAAAFQGPLRQPYAQALRRADETGTSMVLRVLLDDPRLEQLPWEFLYDPERRESVALSSRTLLVRQRSGDDGDAEDDGQAWPDPVVPRPLRVLVATVAGPADPDGPSDELRALRDVESTGALELVVLERASPDQLWHAVKVEQFHVLHLMGDLLLADGAPINAEEIKGAVRGARRRPNLVTLNCCSSAGVAAGLSTVVPAAVGIAGDAMSNKAAARFAESLYRGLGEGKPLEWAVTQARQSIATHFPESREWGLPVLYLNPRGGLTLEPLSASAASGAEAEAAGGADADPERRVLWAKLRVMQQSLDLVMQALKINPSEFSNGYTVELQKRIDALKQLLKV